MKRYELYGKNNWQFIYVRDYNAVLGYLYTIEFTVK